LDSFFSIRRLWIHRIFFPKIDVRFIGLQHFEIPTKDSLALCFEEKFPFTPISFYNSFLFSRAIKHSSIKNPVVFPSCKIEENMSFQLYVFLIPAFSNPLNQTGPKHFGTHRNLKKVSANFLNPEK
jgi:hypothetical protein